VDLLFRDRRWMNLSPPWTLSLSCRFAPAAHTFDRVGPRCETFRPVTLVNPYRNAL